MAQLMLDAVLLLAALMAVPRFYEVDAKAGLLLLPYIGWTCFSSTLINCSLQKRGKQVITGSSHVWLHGGLESRMNFVSNKAINFFVILEE